MATMQIPQLDPRLPAPGSQLPFRPLRRLHRAPHHRSPRREVRGPPVSRRALHGLGRRNRRHLLPGRASDPARTLVAPVHLHTREDEYSYVLEGRMGAQLGDDVVYAEPGDLVFKPRNQWHTFWNAGDTHLPAPGDHLARRLRALLQRAGRADGRGQGGERGGGARPPRARRPLRPLLQAGEHCAALPAARLGVSRLVARRQTTDAETAANDQTVKRQTSRATQIRSRPLATRPSKPRESDLCPQKRPYSPKRLSRSWKG